jgi:uncharacterized coiled-coil protein SlyX
MKICKISSYFSVSLGMTPIKADMLNEIENLNAQLRQKDQQMQSQRDELISLYQAMTSMNQAIVKALGVPYEPPQLDMEMGMYHFLNLV